MAVAFDGAELLERVDHDLAFLAETVEMLASDGRALLGEVRGHIAAGDAAGLGRAAHALKGMLSNFCAAATQQAAQELERMGKGGDLAGAAPAAERLEAQVEALIDELVAFVRGRA